jgi:hypothetical protein
LLKQNIAIILACLMFQSSIAAAAGSPDAIREQVRHMRPGSRLEVKLRNREQLRGKLGSVDERGFELRTTAAPVRVAFSDVESVRHKGGLSREAKIGLAVGIFVGMAGLIAYLVLSAIGRNG